MVCLCCACAASTVHSPPALKLQRGGTLVRLLSSAPTDSLAECSFARIGTEWTTEELDVLHFRVPLGYNHGKLDGLTATGRSSLDRGTIPGREWLPGLAIPTTVEQRLTGLIAQRYIADPSGDTNLGARVFDVMVRSKSGERYPPDYPSVGTSDSWKVLDGYECRLPMGQRSARVLLARYGRDRVVVYYFGAVWLHRPDVYGVVRAVGDEAQAWSEFMIVVSSMH